LQEAVSQLHAHSAGARDTFDLPLALRGSGLQRADCTGMSDIRFGETRTYRDIAKRLGVPAQAVDQAC
jgi:methylated-DNA-[protein]-cysteine S-methyltransferase